MTLNQAVELGISRVRRPIWANPKAYVRIDLVGKGMIGPWLHLYDRGFQELMGDTTPQSILNTGDTTSDYEEYTGELDKADAESVSA